MVETIEKSIGGLPMLARGARFDTTVIPLMLKRSEGVAVFDLD
jgi:hypothetical protein